MNTSLKTIISIIAIVAAAVGGYYIGYDQGWENAPKAAQNETGNETGNPDDGMQSVVSFHKNSAGHYVGGVTLTGYAQVERRVCNPGDMCNETVDYVNFIFDNPDNADFKEFLGLNEGNSFAGNNKIGLGCKQENNKRVFYENFADHDGSFQGEIKGSEYEKLMGSSASNKVTINMVRDLYTSGQGAPDCYTHFRNFEVL